MTKLKNENYLDLLPNHAKKEVAGEYFELDQDSPYMNIVAHVRPTSKQKIIPVVTHTGNTARIYTVDKDINLLYWKPIDAFEKRTGIGVLSFNIQGSITESPSQAIDCFSRSSVDMLAIDPYLCDSEWLNQVASIDR
jgi:carbamoyltransferase